MIRLLSVVCCFGLLLGGLGLKVWLRDSPTPEVRQDPRGITAEDGWEDPANLVIDIHQLQSKLEALRPDEWSDQIADWAVYGVLSQSGLSADAIRQATFNLAPFRFAHLDEVLEFDYGPGRRVLMPNGEAWLFYSARDAHPHATLARQMDRVRMELGEVPDSLTVFEYRSELSEGAIYLERREDLATEDWFSPAKGYIEATVTSAEEMASFLGRIDDLTHTHLRARQLTLGGRRFEEKRTQGVDLEDVAVLYQAHQTLSKGRKDLEETLRESARPILDRYDALVDRFNRLGQQSYPETEIEPLTQDVEQLAQELGLEESHDFEIASSSQGVMALRRRLEALGPVVERFVERRRQEHLDTLVATGEAMADDPGFSLDPRWDLEGLRRDLDILLQEPAQILRSALDLARLADDPDLDDSTVRPAVASAIQVRETLADLAPQDVRFSPHWRDAIREITAASQESSRDTFMPIILLEQRLRSSIFERPSESRDSVDEAVLEAQLLWVVLEHLQTLHVAQCARYDGPLQGSRVGMNLYYTDLLAKLWASVDYGRQSPIHAIDGFRSEPIEGPSIEPLFWPEVWTLTNTRLWFGPKEGTFRGIPSASGGLNFSHVATRVYTAGSNPLEPKAETVPAEMSRRVFGWWDRNYAKVADYEQAYHRQNQIMKWSILTGWLAQHQILPELGKVEVERHHRFDTWYRKADDLKFRLPLPFLPEERWVDGNECVELFRSYTFTSAGSSEAYIEGGVSLGSVRTLSTPTRIARRLPTQLRQGWLRADQSRPEALVSLRNVSFDLPKHSSGRPALVRVQIPDTSRLRVGGSQLEANSLTSKTLARPQSLRIELAVGDRRLGHLVAGRSSGRLRWNEGQLSRDRSLLNRAAKELAEGTKPRQIDSLTRLSSQRGHYLVELQEGQIALVRVHDPTPGSLASSSNSPSSILRSGSFAPSTTGRIYLRTAAPGSTTQGMNRLGRAEAATVDEVMARSWVDRTRWQELKPAHSPELGSSIQRIFSNRGPPATARSLQIETGDPLLGRINAFVDNGTLYLRRPNTSNLQAVSRFNDLVNEAGFNASSLQQLASSPRPVQSIATNSAHARGYRAAQNTRRGQFREALREFRVASEEGKLRPTVDSYMNQLRIQLGDPEHFGIAHRLTRGTSLRSRGDSHLASALDAARRQRPNLALERIEGAIAAAGREGIPPPRILGRAGYSAADDFVRVRLGHFDGLAPEVASATRLQVSGFRYQTVLPKRLLPTSRQLSWNQQLDLVRRWDHLPPNRVYVQDTAMLNKLDWDGAPGPTLSGILRNPKVRIEVLEARGLAGFRPSRLIEGERQLLARPIRAMGLEPSTSNFVVPNEVFLIWAVESSPNPPGSDEKTETQGDDGSDRRPSP